jgi:general secretion pathway protein M
MSALPAAPGTSPSAPSSPFKLRTAAANRNVAVVVLLLLIVAVVGAIVGPAWWLYDRYDSAAAQLARQLRSYTSLNQMRPQLVKSVEVLKARDTKKYFLKGGTAALAGAELQDVVRGLIEANNGKLLSSQLLAHKDDSGYRQVNATITMMANIQNLRQVLYAMETREPYLFLDNLTIRSQVPSNFKPQPGVEPEMFIQFDVAALTPTAPPSPTASTAPAADASATSKTSSKAKP